MKIPKLFSLKAKAPDEMIEVRDKLEKLKSDMPEDILVAHTHSSKHHEEIVASKMCGCFYCLRTFSPNDIVEWIDDGQCAMCPRCGIDSVLGDKSGYPLTPEFLGKMKRYWFDS